MAGSKKDTARRWQKSKGSEQERGIGRRKKDAKKLCVVNPMQNTHTSNHTCDHMKTQELFEGNHWEERWGMGRG